MSPCNSRGYLVVSKSIFHVELITVIMAILKAFWGTFLHVNKVELPSRTVLVLKCAKWGLRSTLSQWTQLFPKINPQWIWEPATTFETVFNFSGFLPLFFVYLIWEFSLTTCLLDATLSLELPEWLLHDIGFLRVNMIIFSRTSWNQKYCQARVHWMILHCSV